MMTHPTLYRPGTFLIYDRWYSCFCQFKVFRLNRHSSDGSVSVCVVYWNFFQLSSIFLATACHAVATLAILLACLEDFFFGSSFSCVNSFSDYCLLYTNFPCQCSWELVGGPNKRIYSLVPNLTRYSCPPSSCPPSWTISPRSSTRLSSTPFRTVRAGAVSNTSSRRWYRALGRWTVPNKVFI